MVETRSQRQAYLQRPPYPSVTTAPNNPPSASSSVFQSSSSLSSLSSVSSPTVQQAPPYASSPSMMQTSFSAPLPSPSTQHQPTMNYFSSISQGAPTSHPAAQQRIPQQYQQQQSGLQAGYMGQRGNGGGVPETQPFLQDFNLVAEAAKRAQVACLARDLGDCGL